MANILLLFIDIVEERGIQNYNRHLLDALEAGFPGLGFTAVFLRGQETGCGKRWRNVEMKFCGISPNVFLRKLLFVFNAAAGLMKRPSFLIVAHADIAPIGLAMKKIFGLKYAVLTHGIDCWSVKKGIKHSALKNADLITAVSGYSRQRMIANGISADRIRLLPNAVDTSLFREGARDEGLLKRFALERKKILLTVGSVSSRERYKGHDMMLEALKKLGDEYVWLIIGSGDDLGRLREKAKDLGIERKARFLGRVENKDLPAYYNLCDAFVMPSKGEGFGIVFLEAMACGKPVIGGDKDGSSEPLMGGELGLLVDPDNADEITRAIESACGRKADEALRRSLPRRVEENFGIKVFNERVKEVFLGYIC